MNRANTHSAVRVVTNPDQLVPLVRSGDHPAISLHLSLRPTNQILSLSASLPTEIEDEARDLGEEGGLNSSPFSTRHASVIHCSLPRLLDI